MNLVRESVSFERKKDTYDAIGVGKIALIERWLNKYGIKNYIINDDLTINTHTFYVHLCFRKLSIFPDYINFNLSEEGFNCSRNDLISLKGCPIKVIEYFSCSYNNLSSLEGCPKYVGGDFYCDHNKNKFTKDYVKSLCKIKGKIYN